MMLVTGIEIRTVPGTVKEIWGERVELPPSLAAAVIAAGSDSAGIPRNWAIGPVATGSVKDGPLALFQRAIREFPLGEFLEPLDWRVEGATRNYQFRDWGFWNPPRDAFLAEDEVLECTGTVMGIGVGVEYRYGELYPVPFISTRLTERYDTGSLVPVTVQARRLNPLNPADCISGIKPARFQRFVLSALEALGKTVEIGNPVRVEVAQTPIPHYMFLGHAPEEYKCETPIQRRVRETAQTQTEAQ